MESLIIEKRGDGVLITITGCDARHLGIFFCVFSEKYKVKLHDNEKRFSSLFIKEAKVVDIIKRINQAVEYLQLLERKDY